MDDERIDGQRDGQWMNRWTKGWKDVWMDGEMDRWRMDGWYTLHNIRIFLCYKNNYFLNLNINLGSEIIIQNSNINFQIKYFFEVK